MASEVIPERRRAPRGGPDVGMCETRNGFKATSRSGRDMSSSDPAMVRSSVSSGLDQQAASHHVARRDTRLGASRGSAVRPQGPPDKPGDGSSGGPAAANAVASVQGRARNSGAATRSLARAKAFALYLGRRGTMLRPPSESWCLASAAAARPLRPGKTRCERASAVCRTSPAPRRGPARRLRYQPTTGG